MTENSVQSSFGLICIVQGLLVWTPGLCGTNAVTWILGSLMGPERIFDGARGHLEMRTVSSTSDFWSCVNCCSFHVGYHVIPLVLFNGSSSLGPAGTEPCAIMCIMWQAGVAVY